jgi:hypothetical protein
VALKETEDSTLPPAPTTRQLCSETPKSYKGIGIVGFLMGLDTPTEASGGYSKQYPRNSRSLTTFSCLTNTVMLCREPLPFLLASFL